MPRLPEMSIGLNKPHKYWGFLSCLSLESLVNLEAAISYNHRGQHVHPPAPAADIMDFDADKEVRRAPHSENHMRPT